MAMEELEIHSKSYLVRWVNVAGDHTISWSIQPHKKSINFGIFKHPGGPSPPITAALAPDAGGNGLLASGTRGVARHDDSTAAEKLQSVGLRSILWVGKCAADKVSTGKHDVAADQAGMYALVFDNTFSKQVSKTATFVLLTYPSSAPPQTTHHLHHLRLGPAGASSSTLDTRPSPRLGAVFHDSTDSLHRASSVPGNVLGDALPRTASVQLDGPGMRLSPSDAFYTGVLSKRRRKRHQGFARRFFSLDYTSSTLSYYHNKNSSALRGAIPLSLAAVGTNDKSREISIDSGAEVWHLRAANQKDFEGWKEALERASRSAAGQPVDAPEATIRTNGLLSTALSVADERDWGKIEALVGRVAGTRDAVRRLAASTQPSLPRPTSGLGMAASPSPSPVDSVSVHDDYFRDKRPFWKRKPSSNSSSPGLFRRSPSAQLTPTTPTMASAPRNGDGPGREEADMHGHCVALLNDLDSVVADFSALIGESRRRRMPVPFSAVSHRSVDSRSTGDFFDAEDGEVGDSTLLVIPDHEDDRSHESDANDESDTQSSSDAGSPGSVDRASTLEDSTAVLFPPRPKSLAPLPLEPTARRLSIPPASATPPSLIGFLRKNVGKDLSTLAMPVSANEPTSLLQRISEPMEYSELLDAAASSDLDEHTRLLYVTAFAISSFSMNRVKERSIRKPFNPLLGETFELVREDKGFRFVAEKVSHRPVRMACQAEASEWTLTHFPMPTQKFWGKSVELNTEGRVRVVLHSSKERYSWTGATCFLRNIIAGEKYVEPVGTMTVANETTGDKAVVTFKAKGMFSGRSEDVVVQAYDKHSEELPLGLAGKWTSSLALTEHGRETRTIWSAGALVDDATACYGLTTFAASLNEVTALERGRLPPTDSRLRPDQRAAEDGLIDAAETVKGQLEEAQRARRALLEAEGREWTPRWFERAAHAGDEELWRLKTGRDGYWDERQRGEWAGVADLFAL
ncbi:MAG: hypothetical protein M1832_002590 [Thelocarpon impressellum]|nr:MAG: hypothetical protein M1832_002590 [Thelocarpon impressellum]